jgi:tetratricopeptide (TPR) repeat protein
MSFSDAFIQGRLIPPTGPRTRTFAQWSLERTVDRGFRANRDQLKSLTQNIRSSFDAGVDRLAEVQARSTEVLKREIQQQTDSLIEALESGSSDIVGAIQAASDYLGGELSEIHWAIERHSEVSARILNTLLTSLDNTARQYWEQGLKCYEAAEFTIAKERFNRSLEADRTNHFAYEYLGFIAVHEDDDKEAILNFNLAQKFAQNDALRALAFSHLARAYSATGDYARALDAVCECTRLAAREAKYHYQACTLWALAHRSAPNALKSLRAAVDLDLAYWSIAAADPALCEIRDDVLEFLADQRAERAKQANRALTALESTTGMVQDLGLDVSVANKADATLRTCKKAMSSGTVFDYLKAVSECTAVCSELRQGAVVAIDSRLAGLRTGEQQQVEEALRAVRAAEANIEQLKIGKVRAAKRSEAEWISFKISVAETELEKLKQQSDARIRDVQEVSAREKLLKAKATLSGNAATA